MANCPYDRLKEGDLVRVTWQDASGLGAWEEQKRAYENAGRGVCMCCSVGWATRITPASLSIHASKSTRDTSDMDLESICDQTKIPKGCVIKIEWLEVLKPNSVPVKTSGHPDR